MAGVKCEHYSHIVISVVSQSRIQRHHIMHPTISHLLVKFMLHWSDNIRNIQLVFKVSIKSLLLNIAFSDLILHTMEYQWSSLHKTRSVVFHIAEAQLDQSTFLINGKSTSTHGQDIIHDQQTKVVIPHVQIIVNQCQKIQTNRHKHKKVN